MKAVGLMLASNNCEGGRCYGEMVKACKDTWWKGCPENIKMFSVYANDYEPKSSLDGLKPEESKLINQDIVVGVPSSRNYLFKKTLLGFEFLLRNYDFDYIFRPNCGSYVNLQLLNKYLSKKPREKYYDSLKGMINHWGYKDLPYGSGSCFIISRDVAELLVNDRENIEYICMDDVTIGIHLHKKGISLHDHQNKPANNGVPWTEDPDRICINNENDLVSNFNKKIYHYYFCHTINPALVYKCHNLTVENHDL